MKRLLVGGLLLFAAAGCAKKSAPTAAPAATRAAKDPPEVTGDPASALPPHLRKGTPKR